MFDLKASGFPYPGNVVMTFLGGSNQHGAKVEGSDEDVYGIFIEPPHVALGIDNFEHFVSPEKPLGSRGQNAGGTDICLHSLQKWASLAAKGNPTVLSFLFSKPLSTSEPWKRIVEQRGAFLARTHIAAYLGYAQAQVQKLDFNTSLDAAGKYDYKAALHVVRLLSEAKELMSHGTITYPRPERELLLEIRGGKLPFKKLLDTCRELERAALLARTTSKLPERVDRDRISQLISGCYLYFWRQKSG